MTFWAELLRTIRFYDFNAPLQPFTWFGGLGVPGWSKLALFWEVRGLAGHNFCGFRGSWKLVGILMYSGTLPGAPQVEEPWSGGG